MDRWLTAAQALPLLGVKPQTLYANVSRGRIRARPDPAAPQRSLYHGDDVRRLAARRRGRRSAQAVAAETLRWGDPVLASAITTVADGRLYFRGRDALALADTSTFEDVCALLWDAGPVPIVHADGDAPTAGRGANRLALALTALAERAGRDAPSTGRSKAVLAREAGGLVGLVAAALLGRARSAKAPMHERMAGRCNAPKAAGVLRKALVLLADHELNASTFAARVAVSTGAPLAAGMLCGLATLTGPLHGGAAAGVQALAKSARRAGASAAVRDWLAQGHLLRAFGHPLYPAGDPRAAALLSGFRPGRVYEGLRAEVESLTGERPNVDFALAALADAFDLPAWAPFAIFAIARSAGWMAHALEQSASAEPIRPRARYVGVAPQTPAAPP